MLTAAALLVIGIWAVNAKPDAANIEQQTNSATQKTTIPMSYENSTKNTTNSTLKNLTAKASNIVDEHFLELEEEKKAEEERIAEEERLAEEARIAEKKRLEEERIAKKAAAEKERQLAVARASTKRTSDATANAVKDGVFTATAYYPRSETATTATGENLMELLANGEKIVACNDYPLGTILLINGQKWRVADRMGYNGYVDFLLASEEEVYQFGRQQVKVEVVN